MSQLVANAAEETLKRGDDFWFGSFEPTDGSMGQLITRNGTNDELICPQGLTKPFVISEEVLDGNYQFVTEETTVTNEEVENGLTAEDVDIYEGADESQITEEDVVVDDETGYATDSSDLNPITTMVRNAFIRGHVN